MSGDCALLSLNDSRLKCLSGCAAQGFVVGESMLDLVGLLATLGLVGEGAKVGRYESSWEFAVMKGTALATSGSPLLTPLSPVGPLPLPGP